LTNSVALVHYSPGRVRFRIYRLKNDSDYAASLQQFLLTQPDINSVRVNGEAASIAIRYRYTGAVLAEIVAKLTSLIEQAAITRSISSEATKERTLATENWSSLTLPVLKYGFIPMNQRHNFLPQARSKLKLKAVFSNLCFSQKNPR
jgi:Heavy metal associated domain 2